MDGGTAQRFYSPKAQIVMPPGTRGASSGASDLRMSGPRASRDTDSGTHG